MKNLYLLSLSLFLLFSSSQVMAAPVNLVSLNPAKIAETVTPTFNLDPSYCANNLPVLPITSIEGITGTWSPAQVTATGSYVFTPYALQDASSITVLIIVVPMAPTFTNLPTSYCQDATPAILPTLSSNFVIGTWSPSVVDTSVPGTQTYVFTGMCGSYTLNVTINPLISPVFSFPTYVCFGITPPILPSTSDNGITGTWLPNVISLYPSGDYVFTPTSGCAVPSTVHVSATYVCDFVFSYGAGVECEFASNIRKFDADINSGPCIKVCSESTQTYSINGPTNLVDHIDWNITGGVIVPGTTPNEVTVNWTDATTTGAVQGTIFFNNGFQLQINKCIEKVAPPHAQFGVFPEFDALTYLTCRDQLIYFSNFSTSNSAADTMHYLWNFGDATNTSTEFQPSHSYSREGVYTVTLQIYSGCSCIGTYTMDITVTRPGFEIVCPGVVCEGGYATYSISGARATCSLNWEVEGGQIVGYANNQEEVHVVWDAVTLDGYGFVSLQTDCSACVSRVKVPIVQQHGAIKGNPIMCADSQRVFSLPQWPTTIYNWDIEDLDGNGAHIEFSQQSNQVYVVSASPGVVKLKCSYYNTLLSCSGAAELEIVVRNFANIGGNQTVCPNTPETYNFTDSDGLPLANVSLSVSGPDGYTFYSSSPSVNISFPTAGIYTFELGSAGYCTGTYRVTVQQSLPAPTEFDGPELACPGLPANYTCIPPSGAVAHWSVTNGTIAGNATTGNEISVNWDAQATSYGVSLYYSFGNCFSPAFSRIIPRDIPNVLIFGNSIACGSSVESYSISDLNAETITWSVEPASAGSVSIGQNTTDAQIQWNQSAGSGATIRVAVRKCGATYDQFTKVVNIVQSLPISISGPATGCATTGAFSNAENDVQFTLSGVGSMPFSSIIWDFEDNHPLQQTSGTGYSSTILHNFSSQNQSGSTTHTVTVTVYGLNGCTTPSVATKQIVIYPAPIVSISPSGNLKICPSTNPNASAFYTLNVQSGFGSTATITWHTFISGVDSIIPFEDGPSINLAAQGAGLYWAVVSNGQCTSLSRKITVTEDCGEGPGDCSAISPLTGYIVQECQSVKGYVTSTGGSPTWTYNFSGATVTQPIGTAPFMASNIEPGSYTLNLLGHYTVGNQNCATVTPFPFVVPYKAGLVYNITCGSAGMYNVKIIDQSVIYPPIQEEVGYMFRVDTGPWQPGTVDSPGGPNYRSEELEPGEHILYIKLTHSNPAFDDCIKEVPVNLPAFPTATFTHTPACANEATHFFAQDTADSTFEWTFSDGSSNVSQNPFKEFPLGSLPSVTLTVTSKYGCPASSFQLITVNAVDPVGAITVAPAEACQGDDITLTYTASPAPLSVQWYKNSSAHPVANPGGGFSLTVMEPGNYFAYATNSNGCVNRDTDPVTAIFIPSPASPQITGPLTVCEGSTIHLSVPENPAVQYTWTRNGTVVSTSNIMEDNPTISGGLPESFTYIVTAQSTNPTAACISLPSYQTVTVVAPPETPNILLDMNNCDQYEVRASVEEPQAGVEYYWSNGDMGAHAYLFHDGPLQVTAVAGDCSVSVQTDLPLDLNTLAWTFPSGCFSLCKSDAQIIEIVGPVGEFTNWAWVIDGNAGTGPPFAGTGQIHPFDQFTSPRSYELVLLTPECEKYLGTMFLDNFDDCRDCDVRIELRDIRAFYLPDHSCAYEIDYQFGNNSPDTYYLALSMQNNAGVISQSSITVPPTGAIGTFVFIPDPTLSGNTATVHFQGHTNGGLACDSTSTLQLPQCGGGGNARADLNPSEGKNMLLIAPNPAAQATMVYYGFAKSDAKHSVEIRDLMGRSLFSKLLNAASGEEVLDLSRYTQGTYIVMIIEDGTVLKSTKLVLGN